MNDQKRLDKIIEELEASRPEPPEIILARIEKKIDKAIRFGLLLLVGYALAFLFIGTWIGWMAAFWYYFPIGN